MVTITEQAWEAFHAPLHQFIRRRVADEAAAEDLLQEVFLKIHQQGASLRDARRLESWIYQITRNLIIDYYRSHHHFMAPLDASEVRDLPEELPDDDLVSGLLPCVQAMVLALPDQDRQALIFTEYQRLTQKELGERLGLSFSGAKSRVQRAREKLKQELLACCHFELDRQGYILDDYPHCDCCEQTSCETNACQHETQAVRPFSPNSVSVSKGKREGHRALLVRSHGKEETHEDHSSLSLRTINALQCQQVRQRFPRSLLSLKPTRSYVGPREWDTHHCQHSWDDALDRNRGHMNLGARRASHMARLQISHEPLCQVVCCAKPIVR